MPTLLETKDASPATAAGGRARNRTPMKKAGGSSTPMKKGAASPTASPKKNSSSPTVAKSPVSSTTSSALKKRLQRVLSNVDGDLERFRAKGVYWLCAPLLLACLLYRVFLMHRVVSLPAATVVADKGSLWSMLTFTKTPVVVVEKALLSTSLLNALALTLATVLVASNSILRLHWPSSYVPARQVDSGFLKSPICARMLATVCEFAFYKLESHTFGLYFYSWDEQGAFHVGVVGLLCTVGELLCWAHLLLQSELLGWLEDSTWTVLQMSVLYLTNFDVTACVLLLPYVLHMEFLLLPRQFSRVWADLVAEKKWKNNWAGVKTHSTPDADTLSWMTTSLLAAPVLFGILLCVPASATFLPLQEDLVSSTQHGSLTFALQQLLTFLALTAVNLSVALVMGKKHEAMSLVHMVLRK